MASPFPGMDPYVEINPRWEGVHDWFVRELARQALPRAQALGCWIDVDRSIYFRDPSGKATLLGQPDHSIREDALPSSWTLPADQNGGIAAPQAVHEAVVDPEDPEAVRQDYLVVRESDRYPHVLAVVEVLSPGNKKGDYAKAYRAKRAQFLVSRSNFMEIDLLRDGRNPSRLLFPELPPAPYFIYVARQRLYGRNDEGYALRLQDPLPTVALPLDASRPDLLLNLQEAFNAAFDLAIRRGSIRYRTERVPPPALAADDAAWVRQLVEALPTTDSVEA